ncbi:MAG: biotin--[Lentisphaeria bacterium]|nr:biotin--[acetyl-CoA-carboxylase] ligase [Lentisphaeria bacterium]
MKEAQVIFLDEVDSTNKYAKEHFAELPDGTLVTASRQTAGRGRQGRQWISPADENIYATMIIKNVHPDDLYLTTAAGSLAVLETLREFAPGYDFFLKWPNDVYVNNQKICGILTESVLGPGYKLEGVAVGLGININSELTTFDGLPPAASLYTLTGQRFFLKNVIFSLAKHLLACYIIYIDNANLLFDRWRAENRLIGQELEFEPANGESFRAVFRDVLRSGEAVLETAQGLEQFTCGDVRILKDSITF